MTSSKKEFSSYIFITIFVVFTIYLNLVHQKYFWALFIFLFFVSKYDLLWFNNSI